MSTKGYIFIDAEYCYTCAVREGMVPSYKAIFELFNKNFPESVKILYHVGEAERKKRLFEFTMKLGADYNIIIDYPHVSKTQVIGSNIAIDSIKYMNRLTDPDTPFVFLTGDDYMIPIVEEFKKNMITCHLYYFPAILSKALIDIYKGTDRLVCLSAKYFMYPHTMAKREINVGKP